MKVDQSEGQTVPKDWERERRVACLAAELNGLMDVDLLLKKMLEKARQVVGAEAGTVYTLQKGRLIFSTSQNTYLERLIPETAELPFTGFNLEIDQTTLAGFVAANRRILIVNDTGDIDPDAPFQHFKKIDATNNYACKAVITLPLVTKNNDLLGVLQVINPLDPAGRVTSFSKVDEQLLSFFALNAAMALEKAVTLRDSVLNSVRLVELHDYTESVAHVQRVAHLSTAIYQNWSQRHRVPQPEREHILNFLPVAALVHDVGKVWVPLHILNKPARLDKQERAVMEAHVKAGARLYAGKHTPLDRLAYSLVSDHHERWDGLGYPGFLDVKLVEPVYGHTRGKKGEEISIYGRILAAADVFDALSSRKAYKEAVDEDLAVQIMEQESGHHFDPAVIESFLAVRPILRKIRERFPERTG
ncbi:MAG: GAF domain-containing protein [Deltaproteobacteria bacterium]|nr:GAF domain-containing protein [Deltaproteobacteria bacterium]